MSQIIEVLISLLPVLIISFTLIYIFHEGMRFMKERDGAQRAHDMAKHTSGKVADGKKSTTQGSSTQNSETLLKLKLQAAERFTLYLERISPDRLVMRLHQNGMSARMLQTDMLKNIREEFDHNLSQQIYVSEGAWELIRNAKDEMLGFVSATGDALKSNATGMDLSRKLFETASKVENMPHDVALKFLRAEVRKHS